MEGADALLRTVLGDWTGLDWMDIPWTVVTTRALVVLKKKEIRRRKPLLTSEQQNALSL